MNIDIICPLYNAEKHIINLDNSLRTQKKVNISNVIYILTESTDESEAILKNKGIDYLKIKKSEFSHSLVREKAAMNSTADIICFVTQDIIIEDPFWLYNLVCSIESGECEAAYSRQISKFDNIEKYTRERNYPPNAIIKDYSCIERMGLDTFFFSDASSAILTKVFKDLKGYDGMNLPTNEDMYLAYKLIKAGYRIKYRADSIIYHSHNFTFRELFYRYKDIGVFMKQNQYLDQYGTSNSGFDMAKYILKRAIKEKNYSVILRFPFDMLARFIGMKVGKIYG